MMYQYLKSDNNNNNNESLLSALPAANYTTLCAIYAHARTHARTHAHTHTHTHTHTQGGGGTRKSYTIPNMEADMIW